MSNRLIRSLIVLGGLAILGIIFVQSYWTIKSYDLKDEEFHQSAMIALRKVAEKYAVFNESELPKNELIKRRASNHYTVNINSAIDVNVLEDYLLQELSAQSIDTEVEYAVYDCFNDNLVYGNCCRPEEELDDKPADKIALRKFDDLVYYFQVKFPEKNSYLLSNLRQTILFNGIALLACLFFIYAMWVILKQKRLSELQTDFINNMTHEFKTPISSIKIASEAFLNNEEIKKNERLHHYAGIIKEQNQRLNDQVEKVLNLAKSEKDGFQVNKESVNLNDIIQSTLRAEKAKLNQNQVDIKLDLDESIEQIYADRLHLTNVIANVLDNAIKYCKETPAIEITTTNRGRFCTMSIKDNGIGISKENLARIGEKFYRVHTGDLHDVKGFGLGLFYVSKICAAHNWMLDIQSKEGKGTTVSIKMNS